jgi:hypothetical protein
MADKRKSTGLELSLLNARQVRIAPGRAFDDHGQPTVRLDHALTVTCGELVPLTLYYCYLLADGLAVCLPVEALPPVGRCQYVGSFRTSKRGNIVARRKRAAARANEQPAA